MSTPPLPIRDTLAKFYTRKQIAEMVGVDHSTISRWEKKGLIPKAQRFNGMCVYTDTELAVIQEIADQQSAIPEGAILCSICNERQARRGTAICSRCSVKRYAASLRDTLPGMDVKPEPVHDADCSMNTDGVECNCSIQDLLLDEPEVAIEDINNPVTEVIEPGEKQYTRRQVAEMINVSPSTIAKWEQKKAIPLPKRSAFTNQYVYTEEHLNKIIDYAEQRLLQPKTSSLQRAARLTSKSFGKLERTVAASIRNVGGRGIL